MVFTGYFKTEQTAGKVAGYSDVNTSCNSLPKRTLRPSLILGTLEVYNAELDNHLYMQNEASDIGGVYKVLDENVWSGAAVEYNSTSTSTPIYICATTDSFFISDDNLALHNVKWVLTYNAKVSDIPSGETPFVKFKFYAREAGGTETFLFEMKGSVEEAYGFEPNSISDYPSGSVAGGDRLVIKVYYGSEIPS